MIAVVAQSDSAGAGIFGGAIVLVYLAIIALMLVSSWKIWQKMGDPGWMGIVPFLNYWRVYQRTRPEQAILFAVGSFICCLVSLVGLVDLAKLFGKDVGFALGLIFLPFIFFPILAFGNAQYVGPAAPPLGG